MKKTPLIALVMLLTLLSSCVRDEDLELLRHPIHVQGDVDPYLGVPIAYGEMNLSEVLEMLSSQYSGYLKPDTDIVIIQFDTSVTDIIRASGSKGGDTYKGGNIDKKPVGTKDGTYLNFVDTVKEYSVNVTLFDDARLQNIVPGNMDISHLYMNLNVEYQGHCQPGYEDTIRNNVIAIADSLVIKYVDHNYQTHVFTGLPNIPPITISDVLNSQTISFTDVDLAPIINSLPRKITASFRFKFQVKDSWIVNNAMNPNFSKMMDTIKMTYLEYDADLKVEFPFEIHIGMLPYNFDINLGDGLSTVNFDQFLSSLGDNVEAELKDSYLNLAFDNGIPFDFMLSAAMLDSNGVELFQIVNLDTILSAPIAPIPGDNSNTHESIGTTRTTVRAMLNSEKLELLKQGRTIRMGLAMSTGTHRVAVQRSNSLKVKASIQVHPSASIDIPLSDDGVL